LWESVSLHQGEEFRADGFRIVMEPADAIALTGKDRIRFRDQFGLFPILQLRLVNTSLT